MTTPNDEISRQVSQSTGVTAESVLLKKTGTYSAQNATALADVSAVRQSPSTVNPFGSIRKG